MPEFGSVKTRQGFEALRPMDSDHAVKDGVRYSAAPLETGINDSRVEPYNAAKMAARLQAANPGNVALPRVGFDSGHVMADRSKDSVDQEFADDFTFILTPTKPPVKRSDAPALTGAQATP